MLLDVIDSQSHASTQISSAAPLIWALTEGRIGDDRQVLALAQAVGGHVQRVQMRDGLARTLGGRLFNSFGQHAPWHAESCVDSPFPDLMIAAGGRCAALGRWVKEASGGRTKVVIIGRPWARLSDFDLIVTTPQYALPARENVQINMLPLNHVEATRDDRSVIAWARRFDHLPRPWIGVLIGGNSGSFRLTRSCARRLAWRLNEVAAKTGGSLLVTTSSRTPAKAIAILAEELSAPHYLHIWQPDRRDNPHAAILAHSDGLVVTAESASMIAEAVNTGRPVELFQLKERRASRLLTTLPSALGLNWLIGLGPDLGYWTPPRDMRRMHRDLAQRNLVGRCDTVTPHAAQTRLIDRDLARTASRIRQLLVPVSAQDDTTALSLPVRLQRQSA